MRRRKRRACRGSVRLKRSRTVTDRVVPLPVSLTVAPGVVTVGVAALAVTPRSKTLRSDRHRAAEPAATN